MSGNLAASRRQICRVPGKPHVGAGYGRAHHFRNCAAHIRRWWHRNRRPYFRMRSRAVSCTNPVSLPLASRVSIPPGGSADPARNPPMPWPRVGNRTMSIHPHQQCRAVRKRGIQQFAIRKGVAGEMFLIPTPGAHRGLARQVNGRQLDARHTSLPGSLGTQVRRTQALAEAEQMHVGVRQTGDEETAVQGVDLSAGTGLRAGRHHGRDQTVFHKHVERREREPISPARTAQDLETLCNPPCTGLRSPSLPRPLRFRPMRTPCVRVYPDIFRGNGLPSLSAKRSAVTLRSPTAAWRGFLPENMLAPPTSNLRIVHAPRSLREHLPSKFPRPGAYRAGALIAHVGAHRFRSRTWAMPKVANARERNTRHTGIDARRLQHFGAAGDGQLAMSTRRIAVTQGIFGSAMELSSSESVTAEPGILPTNPDRAGSRSTSCFLSSARSDFRIQGFCLSPNTSRRTCESCRLPGKECRVDAGRRAAGRPLSNTALRAARDTGSTPLNAGLRFREMPRCLPSCLRSLCTPKEVGFQIQARLAKDPTRCAPLPAALDGQGPLDAMARARFAAVSKASESTT